MDYSYYDNNSQGASRRNINYGVNANSRRRVVSNEDSERKDTRSFYTKNNNTYRSRDALTDYEFRKGKRRRRSHSGLTIIFIFLTVIMCCFAVFGIAKLISSNMESREIKNFTNAQMINDIYMNYKVLGIDELIPIRGMTKQELYDKVLNTYTWNMKIKNSNPEIDLYTLPEYGKKVKEENLEELLNADSSDNLGTSQEGEVINPLEDITIINVKKTEYDFPNFMEAQIMKQIDEIYENYQYNLDNKFSKKKVDVKSPDFEGDFKFVVTENDDYLTDCINQLARVWNTKAAKGQIEGFDSKKNEFIFGGDHKGFEVDEMDLRKRIVKEANDGNFEAEIIANMRMVDPVGDSVKSKYRYVSTFETSTTDDKIRNNNIKLACEAINGTIIKPGEVFSFNKKVGKRTEEKGYGYAMAYLEGEVIDEIGGGICQLSTTLYNAVYNAGMKIVYRRSHTYEPSYITPGLDATVSYNGTDFQFENVSEYAIGIRAGYAKRKCKVEVFAIPVLPDGVTISLVSKKIQELDKPSISIIESGKASRGTKGSEWQVYKVTMRNGQKEGEIFDHPATYLGHTPTAYEENTYVDKEGILQTYSFKERSTVKKSNKETSGMSSIRIPETTLAPPETPAITEPRVREGLPETNSNLPE